MWKYRFQGVVLAALICASLLGSVLVGCDPVPRRILSKDEKIADLYWIYSQFGQNYAPLEYKQKRLGFDFEKIKQSYLEAAADTKTNDEFFDLMYRFVAEFKDAHTSGSLTNSKLPGRAKVAFLGFSGIRAGQSLLVQELLPTINTEKSKYPIKVGDFITHLNGVALTDLVRSELLKYRDLGQEEANLTFHMNWLFTRVSTLNGQPSGEFAILTVKRGDQVSTVMLPWVVKDLYDFRREQDEALAEKKATESEDGADDESGDQLVIANEDGDSQLRIGFLNFNGALEFPSQVRKKINRLDQGYRLTDGFRLVDTLARWTVTKKRFDSALDELRSEREIPAKAVFLPEAKIFPAFVAREKIYDAEGKLTQETKLVGYIYLNTFSPKATEDGVITEFNSTLATLNELGVQDLVIDLINNGGGSLVLGMRIAQSLSKEKILMPDMQFRLSDTWLDEFETESLRGNSDAERELARRALAEMKEDQASGVWLSRRYSTEMLAPYKIESNKDLEKPFRVVLLVNEMCASMCDIFTAILKDNDMAQIVGSQSMGAGGNVVSHMQAPNSHLTLNQTESLILRKDGSYIENNGVKPDVAVSVNESVAQKFAPVYQKAIEVLSR